ncbi:MAG: adenylate/guanylate cyclase domain-containing protein, partial [Acidobacteriota bacterium]
NREVEADPEQTILQISLAANIAHTHVCGGNGRCSTCRVMVIEGVDSCSTRSEKEQILAERLGFSNYIRLACQTTVDGSVKVRRLVLDNEDAQLATQLAAAAMPCSVGEERELAILFADIRGFTTFAESMLPYDVIHVLNRYYSQVGRIISSNEGYIDNYMGDGFLALFGRDEPTNAAFKAVKSGLQILAELEKLNQYFQPLYNWKIDVGVGIHSGLVVIGTIGAAKSRRETVIGDAVNFASRIESANKELDTHLLVSDEIYKQVQGQVKVGKTAQLKIKGKSGEYALYEITELLR